MPQHGEYLALEGNVDKRDDTIARLKAELTSVQEEAMRWRRQALTEDAALIALRQQLAPLYRALQAVFGEIDAAVPADAEPAGQGGASSAKWDGIKAKLPPRHRELVDLLLLQGKMRRTQIASALKMDYSNCARNVIGIMLRQGWLVENGGEVSLKQI